MSAPARSQVDLPLSCTIPYSVATYCTMERGTVTIDPGLSVGTIRECTLPFFVGECGADSDDPLAPAGIERTKYEVELSPGAGDLCNACGF